MCLWAFPMTLNHLVLFFPLTFSKHMGFLGAGTSPKYFSLLKMTINSSLFLEGQTWSFDTGTILAFRPIAILLFHSSCTQGALQMKYCQYKASTWCFRRMCIELFLTQRNVRSSFSKLVEDNNVAFHQNCFILLPLQEC